MVLCAAHKTKAVDCVSLLALLRPSPQNAQPCHQHYSGQQGMQAKPASALRGVLRLQAFTLGNSIPFAQQSTLAHSDDEARDPAAMTMHQEQSFIMFHTGIEGS